jgi:hypothetical protein
MLQQTSYQIYDFFARNAENEVTIGRSYLSVCPHASTPKNVQRISVRTKPLLYNKAAHEIKYASR